MGKLKVLHVITTLPRLSGAADNTRYTVNLLDPDRYEVHLACGPAELDTLSVKTHIRVIVVKSLVRPFAPGLDLHALWKLWGLLRQEKYDIVHTHNAKAGVLGRVAAKLVGAPIVIHTAHSISFAASASPVTNWAYRLADRTCARLTDKIITVSTLNTKTYLEAGVGQRQQYVTIYSGVETAKYLDRSARAACRAELRIGSDDLLVVWIGRLNRQKDPLTYVQAAKLLSDRFPRMHFVIVGDDPLGESLEPAVRKLIADLQLEHRLRLLGYRRDVDRILAAADLVMHTSLYEGLGRSIVETMLVGIPLVATAVDGVVEAVASGERGGLLVPPSNPVALAQAAAELMDNPHLASQVTAAGRSWALERFEVRDMVEGIDRLYQQLWRDRLQRSL